MSYKSVEELNAMGTDGVAREKLILEEKKLKKSISEIEKTEKENIHVLYQDQMDECPTPPGRVLFNAVMTTSVHEGAPPKENAKIKERRNIYEIQKVLKVGPNSVVEVGDEVLINVENWQLRNLNAPVLLLDVDGKRYEYLVLTDRDVKYVMND